MALADYACGENFRYGSRSSSRTNDVACTRTYSRVDTAPVRYAHTAFTAWLAGGADVGSSLSAFLEVL